MAAYEEILKIKAEVYAMSDLSVILKNIWEDAEDNKLKAWAKVADYIEQNYIKKVTAYAIASNYADNIYKKRLQNDFGID